MPAILNFYEYACLPRPNLGHAIFQNNKINETLNHSQTGVWPSTSTFTELTACDIIKTNVNKIEFSSKIADVVSIYQHAHRFQNIP